MARTHFMARSPGALLVIAGLAGAWLYSAFVQAGTSS